MPVDTLIQKDSCILRAEENLKKCEDQLGFKKTKLADTKARALRGDDSIRASQALEAAQRQVEVGLLEERLKERKEFLADAIADQPRREADRKRAGELLAKAQEFEAKAFKLSEELKKVQDTAQDLREAANKTLAISELTRSEIQRAEEDQKKRDETRRTEILNSLKNNLKSAEIDLANTQKDPRHTPPELILEKQNIVAARQKNLDDFLKEEIAYA